MNPLDLAAAAGQSPQSAQQALGYPALFVLVALGALVPVIPTGALVSSAAVVAFHHQSPPFGVLLVVGVAAVAAFTGDIALYWLGQRGVRSRGGSRWLKRLRGRATPERLEQAQTKLDEHGVLVLVVSRLLPAGRIPVMLACLLAELPLRRFAHGDAPACLAWAAAYGLIGILGGSLFSEPWKGVVLAVVLTLLISAGPALWRWLRPDRSDGAAGPV
ncbi:DedA family protein [Streptomyces antarcticus]|uniref:DedA family protein n=1 Tax=Streptomyces antarcticus TaxID=2996458 RepID=UPI002271BC46|nr:MULTISPECIES: VTT domain-containing protein [unclassified Streptomyces]MCY0940325.1 VTT domain-containing protein [Streptomyces sp. H34-AA3]MCZ4087698.1 VTT domain-containing protein [Streptomyces sp. H34-S5]